MRFRVGVVGCGTIFPMHARSLVNTPGVELCAVCDKRPARSRRAGREYGCRSYLDYQQMLREARCDVVHILTPHYLHAPMAIQALNRKVHVLTEKPIAIRPSDARRMIAAAKKNRVKLGVISQNRYNPGSQLVKRYLAAGLLGKIKSAKLVVTYHKPDSFYRQSDWKGRQVLEGGGVLIDQAIHFIDVLRWLFSDEVAYVEAHTARRMHRCIEVEDLAEGVIRFKGGAYVCFYLMNYFSFDADPEITIDCSKGRARMVKDSACVSLFGGQAVQASPAAHEYIDYGEGRKDYWGFCHWTQIRDFYRSLGKGEEPWINGEEGLRTLAVVHNIYKAARLKRRVYFH